MRDSGIPNRGKLDESAEYGARGIGDQRRSERGWHQCSSWRCFRFFPYNDALDARNFFDVQKAPLHQNQDGFDLGGPVKKNRLSFLFGDYQSTQIRKGQTFIYSADGKNA